MAGPELPQVGPWATDKLDRLRKYLAAYTRILSGQPWCKGIVYVDAFAGAGRAIVRKPQERRTEPLDFGEEAPDRDADLQRVLDGSPRVALSIEPPFTNYVFLESDPSRVERLDELRKEFSDRKIRIHQGDSNVYLRDKLATAVDWKEWRGVVFLDPFGMTVPWETLKVLADTQAIEVFINFPVGMAIQRLLKRRKPAFSVKQRGKLDDYFGDPGWHDLLYKGTPGLFGEQISKVEDAADKLVSWYRSRLKGAFGYVSSAYLVTSTSGVPLYYLIFAGPNETGAKIASDVLKAGQRIRTR